MTNAITIATALIALGLALAPANVAAGGLDTATAVANTDEGKYGQNTDEGKYGQNTDEGKYGQNTDEGKYGRNTDEGKYGQNTDEGKFGQAREWDGTPGRRSRSLGPPSAAAAFGRPPLRVRAGPASNGRRSGGGMKCEARHTRTTLVPSFFAGRGQGESWSEIDPARRLATGAAITDDRPRLR